MSFSIKLSAVVLLVGVILTSCDGGEYVVLKAPPSVRFDPKAFDQSLPVSDVPLIMLATFGYHPIQEMQWKGLYQVSPFHAVNAVVLFTVVTHTDPPMPFVTDPLHAVSLQDKSEVDIEEVISAVINSRKSSLFFDARLTKDGQLDVFTDISGPLGNITQLNTGRNIDNLTPENGAFEDGGLTVELQTVRQVLDTLRSRPHIVTGKTQDFYHFRIEGLARIGAIGQSDQLENAIQLVRLAIQEAADNFHSFYSGNAVIQLVTSTATESDKSSIGGSTGGRMRHLLQSTTTETNITSSLNLAPFFSWYYPELFNIQLWFTVVFTLIVFFVAWCMWFIDPGYDSIIYRLTTPPKIKSD